MNYILNLKRFIVFFFITIFGLSAFSMECADQTMATERTKLLNIQNSDGQEAFMSQLAVTEETPAFPQDIWRKILYKWTPISEVDTILHWNIDNACSLALTCKGLYQFVNSLETYAIVRDILLFRISLNEFFMERGPAPRGTPSIIKEMKTLQIKYNDIEKRNLNQTKLVGGNIAELDSSSELQILQDLNATRQGISSALSANIQSVLGYAAENPEGCTQGDVVVDLADLSQLSGMPLPPYKYDARRDYKRIFRNKCLIIGGTALLASLFIYEGITLYNQYPQAEADAAFAAMLNQTSKEINYGYWSWRGSSIDCYKKYWFSQMEWGMWWAPIQYFPNGREPGYCYFPPYIDGTSQSICFPGNITEWIQQVSNWTGFNETYWLDHVLSIMNGTKHDTRIALCSPNRDGISISCGSAYNRKSQNYWNNLGTVALQLTRGDATCAHDLVIQRWRIMMGLYWGFGSVGSLLFVWLWLVHFLC